MHLIVEYSNGVVRDLGYVGVVDESKNVTVSNSYLNDERHLIVEFSDGTSKDLGYIDVAGGSGAKIIIKTSVNDKLHLIVEYSDGTTADLGYVGVSEGESSSVTIARTYVDDNLHFIVEYSDGSSEDLGYVGERVEVEPPLYTVTFLDANGNLLDTQEVYKGRGAKSPTAPEIADKVFVGWDKDITNIQSDIVVTAVYANAAEYVVTFKDELGNVLKTETVISGHSATAPTPPTREDTVFTGWDTDFSRVMGDITVTAQYRKKNNYNVTFKDYSGLVLGTVSVKEGGNATAPVTPMRDGYDFTGWSSSINNVTSNKTVTAQYKLKSGSNILDISYTINSNNTITVTYAVKGTVKFAGLSGCVDLPTGLTYRSHTDGSGTLANYVANEGRIYFTMTSNNGQNVTSTTTIMTLTLGYSSNVSTAVLTTTIEEFFDQNSVDVSYKVIGEDIRLK